MDITQQSNSKFISKAEIIGSHFINRYCNAIYNSTCKVMLTNTSLNKLDIYKNILFEYIKCIETDINFKSELEGILMYFKSSTKYANMTIDECIDFILIDFIPESLFKDVSYKKKNSLLREIIVNTLKRFTEHVMKSYIHFILNDRENSKYINNLQEIFVNEFCLEKQRVYYKCLNPDPNSKMISNDIFLKMQEKIKNVIESKKKLINDNKQLYNIITNLKKQINTINNELVLVNKTNKLYTEQIKQLKINVNKLNNIIQMTNINNNNPIIINKQKEINEKKIINDTEVTNDDTEVTNDDTEVTNDNTKVTNDDTEVTNDNTKVTNDDTEVTNNNTEVTNNDDTEVTNNDTNIIINKNTNKSKIELNNDNEFNSYDGGLTYLSEDDEF